MSTKTNWASSSVRMPVMRWRVVCAFLETMLIFSPIRALSRVDLPTLGRPTMATYPDFRSLPMLSPPPSVRQHDGWGQTLRYKYAARAFATDAELL